MRIWPGYDLPEDAVTQKAAWIGRTGSGKTYGANVFVEQLLRGNHQVGVLDWVGNWSGLRLNKKGTGPSGLEIYVFGGEFGDIPLTPESGALIADVMVEHAISAVLDISEFSKAKRSRFAADFAERLLYAKRRQKSPMHLVIEESQAFVPQRVNRGGERMLGAFEELIKVGRNRGIGTSLITQRPQAVNKEALNQTEFLLSFQLNAKHERKAIEEWVAEQGMEDDLLADLPRLRPGEAIVWSPMWLDFLGRVKICKRTTFDASKTPEVGDRMMRDVAPLDLGDLESAMAETLEQQKADDPKALKKRIAELEKKLAEAEETFTDCASAKDIEILTAENHALQQRLDSAYGAGISIKEAITEVASLLEEAAANAGHIVVQKIESKLTSVPKQAARKRSATNGAFATPALEELGKGATRRVFEALAFWHPRSLTRSKLAFHADISPKSSTMRAALGDLRKTPYLDESDGFTLSAEGVRAAGSLIDQKPKRSEELIDFWGRKFGNNATGRVFRVLCGVGSVGITRDKLARAANISPDSSTMRAALAELRSCDLLDESTSNWTLSKELL